MRVLLVTPSIDMPGGVANYYKTLRRYLPEEVEYFTVGARAVDDGRFTTLMRAFKDYVNFCRKLRHGGYDLVHLNPSLVYKAIARDGILLLIAKAFRVRVIVFVRGWDGGCESYIRKHFLPLFRFVYRKADAFIVLGAEFRDKLIEMGCTDRIYMETTVVDDAVLSRSTGSNRQRSSEGDGAKLNILTLTRIEKTKGIYEAIDAYHILKKKIPSVTLTIAGDGPELQAVKRYATDRQVLDVSFPGFISGEIKHMAYEHANIFLFPTSYGEGMPNAVLEAMGHGLPIITRPVGGIRDYFENGRMGFITESLDPTVFAGLLETLIVDSKLRVRIGEYNRDYAREHFMASKVAERLQGIYRKVLGNAHLTVE